jgi:hypothetical protein
MSINLLKIENSSVTKVILSLYAGPLLVGCKHSFGICIFKHIFFLLFANSHIWNILKYSKFVFKFMFFILNMKIVGRKKTCGLAKDGLPSKSSLRFAKKMEQTC